jgi:hypothetical protein
VLSQFVWLTVPVSVEIVINLYDFFKIQLFKVNVQPSHQKVNHITLLQLAISYRFQRLYIRTQLSIKTVEIINPAQTFSVLFHKINVIDH